MQNFHVSPVVYDRGRENFGELRRTHCWQKFSLLGSTGSIGTQTLEICAEHPDKFEMVALAAGSNVSLLADQVSWLTDLDILFSGWKGI